ncbi:histidine phosphatase family protein [Thalassobius sp. Cn5-15]|uniref:histidine phosphatase family protein n=1 Tax=Thalassobius sp. Cn5-15 TaxID=2917763 RepID=UPI001EF1E48A|nr:histidine phosphatase family protein [Thalassobius sp. Cn5-15]MCG7493686.1 histidine phosphatase family protein [Thalassobius sp. Cn5-15]
MSRFFWVRHGPTHAKSMVGWSDLPADLSDTALIGRVADHLPGEALVISSDLIRARDTATAVQGARARLDHDSGLREMHFGDWELQRFDEVADQNHIRQFWEQPGDIAPPNGESWNQLSTRVNGVVDRLIAAHPGRDIVAVAHFGVILTQVQRALQVDAYSAFAHKIDNLSVTELHWDGTRWHAAVINHLP